MDVESRLKASSMSRYQYVVVGLIALIQAVDGFDLFVMGFALPYLPHGFATDAEKGFLLSAGLLGLGVGALCLGSLSDRIGRRRMMLAGLGLNAAGMALAASAPNVGVLLGARLITGLGVGAVSVCALVLIQEFSPTSRRNFNSGLNGLGHAFGGVTVGLAAVPLVNAFGSWRSLFAFGALFSAAIFVVAVIALPESLAYLLRKRPADFERKVRTALTRMRISVSGLDLSRPVMDSGAAAVSRRGSGSVWRLFSAELRERTTLLWVMYLGLITVHYFINTWTPQLITNASGDTTLGTAVGTFLGLGGIVGALLFGLVGLRVSAPRIGWISLSVGCAAVLAFGAVLNVAAAAFAAALVLGVAVVTAVTASGGMNPPMYPVELRGSGFGSMLGVGRVGAILAPILVGVTLQFTTPRVLYFAAAVPLLIAAAAAARLTTITRAELQAEKELGVASVSPATTQ
jgi:MFS family permease